MEGCFRRQIVLQIEQVFADHSGPICAMRHIPEPPSPHTPMKPQGSALISLVTPCPIPGPTVLTPGSSLRSYIVPTDQHESFVHTLSPLMRTRENFPIPNFSKPSMFNLEVLSRQASEKEDAPCWYGYSLILLSLGLGYHHPRGQDITSMTSGKSL